MGIYIISIRSIRITETKDNLGQKGALTETLFKAGPMAIFGQVGQVLSQKVWVYPRMDVAKPLRCPVHSMLKNLYGYVVSFFLVILSFGLELQELHFRVLLWSFFPWILSKGDESFFSNLIKLWLSFITSCIRVDLPPQMLSCTFQMLFDILIESKKYSLLFWAVLSNLVPSNYNYETLHTSCNETVAVFTLMRK